MRPRRIPLILAAALAATAALAPASASADGAEGHQFQVTLTNLTPTLTGTPGSQPFSPPLVAVHRTKRVGIAALGAPAGSGLEAIAEDAINAPLQGALNAQRGVDTAFTVVGGPIPSGATRTFAVTARHGFKRLSLASMIVNTNDGFFVADSVRLSNRSQTHYLVAYDAGTEVNDQLAANIPGPCCGDTGRNGTPEGGLVTMHPGITATGDLDPNLFGWGLAPVAKVEIQRVG